MTVVHHYRAAVLTTSAGPQYPTFDSDFDLPAATSMFMQQSPDTMEQCRHWF